MDESSSHDDIAQLGKFGLIELLSEKFNSHNNETIHGIGYSTSVIDNESQLTLTATKQLLENVHFDRTYVDLKLLGYKSLAIVIADILAMNGTPKQFMTSIAISNRYSIQDLIAITDGMALCSDRYNVDMVGLDLTTSQTGLVISVTVLGAVSNEKLVTHAGAKDKELICVSGDFGAAYTGLLLLEREKAVFQVNPDQQPEFVGFDYLLERQLKPEPRLDIINALDEHHILPTAMFNVKDGIASALFHICNKSKVGCVIFENKLPIDTLTFNTLKDLKIVATTVALNGGEDYELLFTITQSDYEKLLKVKNVSVIGYITSNCSSKYLITNDNCQVELQAQGFAKPDTIDEN